ncbi:hypothetical protein [Acidianus sp. HS-5]|uniref:hypothetical protein n=1 Tax=Acidianus sp. HS-5 TaxID=2886040 RepID=UPI001F292CF2|nr:hypothetical protein [Acidianus sp. HS-5]BDC17817.1 S26 family signal peptidase [Acidianus sp. HS-5]
MLRILAYAFLSLILASIVFSLISQYFFGLPYGWNIEATNSMVPELNPGCLVFIMPLIGNPHIGEIVAYEPPFYNHYIVHEVIEEKPCGYITKGIHNEFPDPWIVKRCWIKAFVPVIFGKPLSIPYIGNAISILNSSEGKIYALLTIFGIYIASEIIDRNKISVIRRRRSINTKMVLFSLFILFFIVFFTIFSVNTALTKAQWTSTNVDSFLTEKEIGVSFRIGVVPSCKNITLILPVNVSRFIFKLPLAVLFYSNESNLQLVGNKTISQTSNVTFLLNSGKSGFREDSVGFLIVPEFLPYCIMEGLFAINPLLFISIYSFLLSLIIIGVIVLLSKILSMLVY